MLSFCSYIVTYIPPRPCILGNRGRLTKIFLPPLALILPCHVKRLANGSECIAYSNKVFLIKSAAANGSSQLAVCIHVHTTDHTTDLVYTGTGSIYAISNTTQDAVSNHLIYTCHVQELAIASTLQLAIQKQPMIKEMLNHSIIIGQIDNEKPWTLIVVNSFSKLNE